MDSVDILPLDVWGIIITTPNDYNVMARAWKWADKHSGFDNDTYWKRRFGYKFTCLGMKKRARLCMWPGLDAAIRITWNQIVNNVDTCSCDRNGPILVELERNDLRIRISSEGDHRNIFVTVDRVVKMTQDTETTEVTKYRYDDGVGIFRIDTIDGPESRWLAIQEAHKSTDPVIKSILCAVNCELDWTSDLISHFRM